MKICIYGAGAIGGLLGARLAATDAEVALVARGPHLEALRRDGLTLISGVERTTLAVRATDDPGELGPQDYVIVTLKAHSVFPIVERIRPLLGSETALVTAQNGLLWWYFHGLGGAWEGRRLECADPGGKIWDTLGPERAIGCVVYPAAEIVEPGVVRHVDGKRVMLGEPDGTKSERVVALGRLLTEAGFKAPVRPRIRDDIWLKLWGNVSFNPVSVLTGGTLAAMARDPGVREVVRRLMVEAEAVGTKLGVRFAVDVETRIGWGEAVGEHKTSMLQDFEHGRPLETDALIGAVAEAGRMVGVPTPTIDAVLALVTMRAATNA